ncbi:MAG: DUF370 domain-containing protein [Clostridia bacterium]|nr:DUF370 domain-containing protein [Clostridia bacterium]
MYIHIGQNISVKADDIIGIFDMDNTTVTGATRKYLAVAEQAGRVIYTGYELPASFTVCAEDEVKVYISPLTTKTIQKRTKRENVN